MISGDQFKKFVEEKCSNLLSTQNFLMQIIEALKNPVQRLSLFRRVVINGELSSEEVKVSLQRPLVYKSLSPESKKTVDGILGVEDALVIKSTEEKIPDSLVLCKQGLREVIFIGDLHGDFDKLFDLLETIEFFSYEEKPILVFGGDYIDRGEYSAKTAIAVFLLQLMFSRDVFALRGNHEQEYIVSKDLKFVCTNIVYPLRKIFKYAFSFLPIAVVFPDTGTLCVHGGLPLTKTYSKVNTVAQALYSLLSCPDEVLWNDFKKTDCGKIIVVPRGEKEGVRLEVLQSAIFGVNVILINKILRGHQVDALFYLHDKNCEVVTVHPVDFEGFDDWADSVGMGTFDKVLLANSYDMIQVNPDGSLNIFPESVEESEPIDKTLEDLRKLKDSEVCEKTHLETKGTEKENIPNHNKRKRTDVNDSVSSMAKTARFFSLLKVPTKKDVVACVEVWEHNFR